MVPTNSNHGEVAKSYPPKIIGRHTPGRARRIDRKREIWQRVIVSTLVIGILVSLVYLAVSSVANFFDSHKIVKNQVLKVEVKPPFSIEEREMVSPIAPSPTPDPNKIIVYEEIIKVQPFNISKIVDGIHWLESNRGVANTANSLQKYCELKGETNEYGYGGMHDKICFRNKVEAKARVTLWVVENLEKNGGNLGVTLCKYNTGKESNTCEYYKKYLEIK